MNISFTIDYTGTPDEDDILGAKLIVNQENARRAQQEPPETPLPDSTNAELKASYLEVLTNIVVNAHIDYARQSKQITRNQQVQNLWMNATEAQREAAITALGG